MAKVTGSLRFGGLASSRCFIRLDSREGGDLVFIKGIKGRDRGLGLVTRVKVKAKVTG